TIRRIRDLLHELRLQGRERGGRAGDRHWPIIPRSLASPTISRFWWLDAPSPNPGTHGRPDLGEVPASANPDTHGCPESALISGHGHPICGHEHPISGHGAYASQRDIKHLALESLDSRERERGVASLPLSAEARFAREMEALRQQRPTPSVEERARVAAM